MGVLADAFIVVGGIELGSIAAPRRLLDHAIDVAQPLGGHAQGHDLAAFDQLHNSLNGGSAGHGGIDEGPPPGPPLDPEPLLAPLPPVFGPVTTLQKFAVISSMQNTPVVGA